MDNEMIKLSLLIMSLLILSTILFFSACARFNQNITLFLFYRECKLIGGLESDFLSKRLPNTS